MVMFNKENKMQQEDEMIVEAVMTAVQKLILEEERTGRLNKAFHYSSASDFTSFTIGMVYGCSLALDKIIKNRRRE